MNGVQILCRPKLSFKKAHGWLYFVPVLVWAVSGTASAQRSVDYAIDALFKPSSNELEVKWRARIDLKGRQDPIRLWLYIDRVTHEPLKTNEQELRWIYPNEVSVGRISIREVLVDGKPASWSWASEGMPRHRGGRDMLIRLAPSSAHSTLVTIGYTIVVPERFGRIGRVKDQLSLAAPWYPLVVDSHGYALTDVEHIVRISCFDTRWNVLLGNTFGKKSALVKSAQVYVPAVFARKLYRRGRSHALEWVSSHEPYSPPAKTNDQLDSLRDLLRIDTFSLVSKQIQSAQKFCEALRIFNCNQVRLVVVPSRTELVALAPGWLIISDRFYEVLQLDIARQFHDRVLLRALWQYWAQSSDFWHEPVSDRAWAAEMRASLLYELDALSRKQTNQTPADLLNLVSFHPAVDNLLYASQILYKDAFFFNADSPLGLSDDPERVRDARVHGSKVGENLKIRLPKETYAALLRELLLSTTDARIAITKASPISARLLDIWLQTDPKSVNYRLGAISSKRLGPRRYSHRIELIRKGGLRADPVQVLVEDEDGRKYGAVWSGSSRRGVIQVVTKGPLEEVTLDPHNLLFQQRPSMEGHAREDVSTDLPWRPPLLQGFDLNLSVGDQLVTGFVEFALRKRYVLDQAWVVRLTQGIASTGGSLRYVYGLGPKVHENRRVMSISAGPFVNRLRSGFTEGESAGWNYGLRTTVSWDSRYFLQDPRRGSILAASLEVGRVVPEMGEADISAEVGLQATHYFALGLRHVLLFSLKGGATFNAKLPGQKQFLGGSFALRGYAVDALVDDAAALIVSEYRFTAFSDLHWNALHLGWFREIQLALFGGVGTLGPRIERLFDRQASQVGGGIRIHGDYAGVQPGVFAIDVGLPLNDKSTAKGGIPYFVYFGFDQYF